MGSAIRDFLDSVGRTKTGYAGTPMPGAPPVAPPDLTPTQITDALRDVLKKNIGFGGGDGTFSSTGTSKAGSAQTDAEKYAADKAAFDETLRKYQLDRRAYEQYQGDVNARLRSFNPYADAQYRIMPTNTGAPVPTPTAPAAPTKLNAPTYGAIPITMSTPTDQGASYKQMRDFGYTDADIRSATSKITGSPTDQKWADILSAGYSQYAPAVQGAYQQLGRSGFGGAAGQIDTPGYSYWLNQLSSGAVRPEDLNQAVLTAGRPSNLSEIQNIYQQYFNRTPDTSGLQTWGQSGLTGDALKNAIIGGAQGPDLAYYQQNFGGGTQQPINQVPDPYYAGGPGEGGGAARGGYISKYADGGRVRTHYQRGGRADEGNFEELDAFYRDPRNFTRPQSNFPEADPTAIGERRISTRPINNQPSEIRVDVTAPAPEPAAETPPPSGQQAASRPRLDDIFARYFPEAGSAGRELADARRRSQSESEAFYNLIRQQAERGESPTSRSEMYFRLASAFGAPTRTGSMGETLSKVGEQMGEYTKGRRSEEAERRNLLLRAQEARMAGAREDLATTRALAAQENADRRALVAKMLEISARDPGDRERRIQDIMQTNNVDRTTAANIVNGIERITPNPVTGMPEITNLVTGESRAATRPAAPAAPAAAGAPAGEGATAPAARTSGSAQPPRTLWEMAPSVTGVIPAIREAAQGVTGQVGVNVTPEGLISDRQTFSAVQNDLIRALSVNPRFPVAEMQRIEREIAIAPGALTDPVSLRERMVSIDTYLRGRLQNEDRAANDASLPVDTRRAALSAANSIRDFLAQLGVPEGGRSRSEPAQRNRPQAPRVGTVVDGYRFLGGDPSDQSNWSRE